MKKDFTAYEGIEEAETPHKKKKGKKRVAKAGHRHDFKPFIGLLTGDGKSVFSSTLHYVLAEECSICERQRITNYMIFDKKEGHGGYVMLSNLEEIKLKYPTYEVKMLDEEKI